MQMPPYFLLLFTQGEELHVPEHRRRIKTGENAKVVAAAWRAEWIKFIAALAILHQDDLKNRMKCTKTI